AGDHRLRVPRPRGRARLFDRVPPGVDPGVRAARAVPGPRGEESQGGPYRRGGSPVVRTRIGERTSEMHPLAIVTDGSTAFILFHALVVLIGAALYPTLGAQRPRSLPACRALHGRR